MKINYFKNKRIQKLIWCISGINTYPKPFEFEFKKTSNAEIVDLYHNFDAKSSLFQEEFLPRRIGHQFEFYLNHFFQWSPEWNIILHHHQFHTNGHTIGELDFLLKQTRTGALIHLETAVKFYLEYGIGDHLSWIGPNPKDTLRKKTDKLFQQQLKLTSHPEVASFLSSITTAPIHPKLLLKTQLFCNANLESNPLLSSSNHKWIYLKNCREILPVDTSWKIVEKEDWIPCSFYLLHDKSLLYTTEEIIEKMKQNDIRLPLMIESLHINNNIGYRCERWIIVYNEWPLL